MDALGPELGGKALRMTLRHSDDVGLIREMVLQAKDAAEITHGDKHKDFLFELDEFQMREFLFIYRKSLQECSCAAGLPDPECPQHGVHSVQASVFYDNAYRVNIQSKCANLTGVLRRELLDTGLVTVPQWNDKIAPALVAVDRAVETPRQWAERVTAPLTPFGEAVWKLSVAILLRLEGLCPALRGKALVADIYSLLAISPIVQPAPEVSPTANSTDRN